MVIAAEIVKRFWDGERRILELVELLRLTQSEVIVEELQQKSWHVLDLQGGKGVEGHRYFRYMSFCLGGVVCVSGKQQQQQQTIIQLDIITFYSSIGNTINDSLNDVVVKSTK